MNSCVTCDKRQVKCEATAPNVCNLRRPHPTGYAFSWLPSVSSIYLILSSASHDQSHFYFLSPVAATGLETQVSSISLLFNVHYSFLYYQTLRVCYECSMFVCVCPMFVVLFQYPLCSCDAKWTFFSLETGCKEFNGLWKKMVALFSYYNHLSLEKYLVNRGKRSCCCFS